MTDRRPLYVLGVFALVILIVFALTRIGDDDDTEVLGVTVTAAPSAWEAGLERVTRIENELFANPDPSRVGEIMTADCPCFADTRGRLQALKDKGRHVDGDNLIIESATLNQQVNDDRVRVFVVISDNGRPTVDASGNVTSPSPDVERAGLIYTLARGTDQQWRIADRSPVSQERVEVQ